MKKQPLPQSLVKPQISSVEKETFEATGKFYKESASHNQPNLHACSVSSCDATKLVKDQLTHGDYSAEPFVSTLKLILTVNMIFVLGLENLPATVGR